MTSTLLSPEVIPRVKGRAIILDTNAFVEGFSSPEEFSELLDELTKAECPLTTIEAVRIEFFSKNRSLKELTKKVDFYQNTITNPELSTRTFEAELKEYSLLFAFGMQQGDKFKAVDFMITAAMKKYTDSVLLLTNDHNDFTCRLFDLAALLPLTPAQGPIVPFGLYGFSEEKYAAMLVGVNR